MNRNLLAITVLIALAGLTFVQFRLLVVGAKLEKQRFDQKILVAQRNIRHALDEPNPVSDALIGYLKTAERNKETATPIADSLHVFLKNQLAETDIAAQFSFAITSRYSTDEVDFSSNNFKQGKFHFHEYAIPLGNFFSSQLFRKKHCTLI